MIQIRNLAYQYTSHTQILEFPDIELGAHEHLLVLGKSGVGKTTLLHLIAGLLRSQQGEISIGETKLSALSSRKLDQFRGKEIGLVFQNNHAIRSLNVFENLKARLFFAKKPIDIERIQHLLHQLDIEECIAKKINQLSEGQLQRLGIALAVVHQPQLILADEPTSSLDDKNCELVMQLLLEQAKNNHANLMVITHDHRIKPMFNNLITL
ncbi:ABC transporter ATP-binding protein [Euzebyella saccharophila]|uniref:ABC transporter ATP-binding protein n=1 Tax=Euzebyella saccharophila TaxID=679664 RepID=A0ABV8JSC4_9FLAO|nr:ATP-binding cassette domain-containing protein [Euzebyella saccharophila]